MARWLLGTCLLVVLIGVPAGADTSVFNTSDSEFDPGIPNMGWWASEGMDSIDSNWNTFTGFAGSAEIRSFFTFDLSSLSGDVASATLQLTAYRISDVLESYPLGLWDVTTDASVLNENVGNSPAIFADLGSGVSYGTFTVYRDTPEEEVLSFDLNADAVAAINSAAGGWFSIGGSHLGDYGYFFANPEGLEGTQALVVETSNGAVPELPPFALAALGLLPLGLKLRRRRK